VDFLFTGGGITGIPKLPNSIKRGVSFLRSMKRCKILEKGGQEGLVCEATGFRKLNVMI